MTDISNIHTSVLYQELIDSLKLQDDGLSPKVVIDCTLGLGGHALGVVRTLRTWDTFIGIDADTRNLSDAQDRIESYTSGAENTPKLHFVNANFSQVSQVLENLGIKSLTHIYYDLGVSSRHFDDPEGGFSFRFDAPLDMRFDRENQDVTAADILRKYDLHDMNKFFKEYGEDRRSYYIARGIIDARDENKIETTFDLVKLIEDISWDKKSKVRIFQALRMEVNRELDVIRESMTDALHLLVEGGRMSVITFHSVEDRCVKKLFQEFFEDERDEITGQSITPALASKWIKKPQVPTQEEIDQNPRSRSARLRCLRKN